MWRWFLSWLWRLTHPGQAACRRCAYWKRRNSHYGTCWRLGPFTATSQFFKCRWFLRKCA